MVIEKPIKAKAVIPALITVTLPAPSRRVSLSLKRLDTIVPKAIIIYIIPAYDRRTLNCGYITGHAAPSKESGSPKLINAR